MSELIVKGHWCEDCLEFKDGVPWAETEEGEPACGLCGGDNILEGVLVLEGHGAFPQLEHLAKKEERQ